MGTWRILHCHFNISSKKLILVIGHWSLVIGGSFQLNYPYLRWFDKNHKNVVVNVVK